MPAPDDPTIGAGVAPAASGSSGANAGAASREARPPGSGSSRPTPAVLLLVAGVLLLARIGTGLYESRHPPDLPDLVQWRPMADAEAQARSSFRSVLYDFTADWCPPCRLMKREVFSDRAITKTLNASFFPVRVLDRAREEGRNPPEVAALQARFHVQAFPTLVIVPMGGGEPQVLEGYPGRDETVKWLSRRAFRAHVQIGGPLPQGADSSATRGAAKAKSGRRPAR